MVRRLHHCSHTNFLSSLFATTSLKLHISLKTGTIKMLNTLFNTWDTYSGVHPSGCPFLFKLSCRQNTQRSLRILIYQHNDFCSKKLKNLHNLSRFVCLSFREIQTSWNSWCQIVNDIRLSLTKLKLYLGWYEGPKSHFFQVAAVTLKPWMQLEE